MYTIYTLTIADGETASSEVAIAQTETPRFLQVPTAFTGTAITVEASLDGGTTWGTVEQLSGDSSVYSLTVRAERTAPSLIPLDMETLMGLPMLRFTSGSEEGDDRTLKLVCVK